MVQRFKLNPKASNFVRKMDQFFAVGKTVDNYITDTFIITTEKTAIQTPLCLWKECSWTSFFWIELFATYFNIHVDKYFPNNIEIFQLIFQYGKNKFFLAIRNPISFSTSSNLE